MTIVTTSPAQENAATHLKELGLSEYEAWTFIALIRLGKGTAKDIDEIDLVPRTRVYDAVDSLHDQGLVDIQYSSPRMFTPVSRETALRRLDFERENLIGSLSEGLDELDSARPRREEVGVWTVTDREAVTARVLEFVDDAEEEIVYMTVDELLTERHLDRLRAAAERGVDVYIAGISEEVERRLRDEIPGATTFESLWESSEASAGSLLVTDQRTALVSVLQSDTGGDGPEETAIWGSGQYNNLVVVLRAIFTWRVDALA